jgi:hypothetical protein
MHNNEKNFKRIPEIKNSLIVGNCGVMGILGRVNDWTASDIINNYVQNQENEEVKQTLKQMKIIDFFEISIPRALAQTYLAYSLVLQCCSLDKNQN